MKKTIIILLTAILYSGYSFSQKKIEKIFDKENYHSVIKKLKEKEEDKGLNISENELIALAYYYNNEYNSAYPYFKKIIDIEEFSERNKFYYSHCLKAVGKDSLANILLKEFYQKNKIDLDKNFDDIETIKKIGNRYKIENINSINTEYSDIFSIEYNDKIYFSSTRPSGLDNKKYKWNNQPYLDNYFLSKDSTVNNMSTINTEYHDADITLNKLNDDIYFSSSQPDENIFLKKDQVITSKIFKATFDNGNLISMISLPFNSNNYSCKTPFYDFENKKLYFSSNMPNGKGGFDIYYVNIEDFSNIINVSEVNSINDEDNFFIDSEKNIYFSSNGYVGFGGKDIFVKMYNKETNTYNRIMNIGYPVNSSADDFGYKNIGKKGFFTSNRINGKGDDDIYSFLETKPLELDKIIQKFFGKIISKETGKPVEKLRIILKKDSQEIEIKPDFLGNYQTEIAGNSNYTLIIKADLYNDVIYNFQSNNEKYGEIEKNFNLEMAPCIQIFQGKITDLNNNPLKNALIQFQDAKSKLIVTTMTNEIGEYELSFPCDKLFIFKASLNESTEPYYAEYNEFLETGKDYNKIHKKDVSLINVKSRGLISDNKGNVKIPTKPIYFKYNSDEIESNSFSELDKVGVLLIQNPEWKLYIESHSDVRGSDNYNLILSEKRANKTKDYLIKLGIEKNNIIAKGLGETKPLIECDNRECGEEEHSINRRSEFIIK